VRLRPSVKRGLRPGCVSGRISHYRDEMTKRYASEIARRLLLTPKVIRFAATFLDGFRLAILPWWFPVRKVFRFPPRPLTVRITAFRRDARLTFWSDEHFAAFCEIFIHGDYSFPVQDARTILDVGANVGFASMYFACRYPGAKIFAIEPDPVSFRHLCAQTAQCPNISCWNLALSSANGTLDFYSSKNSLSSSLSRRFDTDKQIRIRTMSLDGFCKARSIRRVDLLKFDVEGAEWQLFSSGVRTPIRVFLGEFHADLVGKPLSAFVALFKRYSVTTKLLYTHRYVVRGVYE